VFVNAVKRLLLGDDRAAAGPDSPRGPDGSVAGREFAAHCEAVDPEFGAGR